MPWKNRSSLVRSVAAQLAVQRHRHPQLLVPLGRPGLLQRADQRVHLLGVQQVRVPDDQHAGAVEQFAADLGEPVAAGALNGRRILLVDGNFRRPEIHRVFGIGNEQGFSDVLNGAVAFEDIVHETQVPNLAIMASGPKPINATEMFESQLLIDFIERALEEFDHVIFDSGPMMVVSESAAMAPRVDGVVTVVRARGSNRGQLTRMVEGLRATKAEHLGVVLNGVRAQGGGYYRRNIKTYYEYQNG